jgi:hypothetical protein
MAVLRLGPSDLRSSLSLGLDIEGVLLRWREATMVA